MKVNNKVLFLYSELSLSLRLPYDGGQVDLINISHNYLTQGLVNIIQPKGVSKKLIEMNEDKKLYPHLNNDQLF